MQANIGPGIFHGSCCSSSLVLQVRDQLEVERVTAESHVAQMVNLLLAGDVAVVMGVHHQVHSHRLAIQAHAAIATTLAFTGGWSLPDMAQGLHAVDLEAMILEEDPGHHLVEDRFTAIQDVSGFHARIPFMKY